MKFERRFQGLPTKHTLLEEMSLAGAGPNQGTQRFLDVEGNFESDDTSESEICTPENYLGSQEGRLGSVLEERTSVVVCINKGTEAWPRGE